MRLPFTLYYELQPSLLLVLLLHYFVKGTETEQTRALVRSTMMLALRWFARSIKQPSRTMCTKMNIAEKVMVLQLWSSESLVRSTDQYVDAKDNIIRTSCASIIVSNHIIRIVLMGDLITLITVLSLIN